MVHRNMGDISFARSAGKRKKTLTTVPENLAWDGETVNGYCVVFCNNEGVELVYGVDFNDLESFLAILTRKEYNNRVNWTYNMNFDSNSIIKYLPFHSRKELYKFGTLDYNNYRFRLIPNKEFSISRIKKNKHNKSGFNASNTTKFYDAAQFYDYAKLDALAIKYTNHRKPVIEDINDLNLGLIINNKGGYRDKIVHRCVMDCVILKEVIDILTDKVNEIVPTRIYRSKASISRNYVLCNISKDLVSPPPSVCQKALWAYHGNLIDTPMLGSFKRVHNYDIRSAYPTQIANLYATTGDMITTKEYNPDVAYGFYQIEIDYSHPSVSPFYYNHSGLNYHPTGRFKEWVSQSEIEFFINKGFDFKILNGQCLERPKDDYKPLEILIPDLYKRRLVAQDDKDIQLANTIKITLNAIYGCFLNAVKQRHAIPLITDLITGEYTEDYLDCVLHDNVSKFYRESTGETIIDGRAIEYYETHRGTSLYNPIFGAEITANTRMKIYNDFWGKFEAGKVISINTDGVFLTEKANVPLGTELGKYDHKAQDKMIFIGNGRYLTLNQLEEVIAGKTRGVPIDGKRLYAQLLESRKEGVVNLETTHVVTLPESIIRHDKDGSDSLNNFETVNKPIYARQQTRWWYDEITTFNDLLNNQCTSRPYTIAEIAGAC